MVKLRVPVGQPQARSQLRLTPVGEAYAAVEGSKGELGFYVVSDGSNRPYRWHERGSSFLNLKSMEV
ncbi:hypothetical protein EON82_05435, partial [bacterium]